MTPMTINWDDWLGGLATAVVIIGLGVMVVRMRAWRLRRRALSPWQHYLHREGLRNEQLAAALEAEDPGLLRPSPEEAATAALEDLERHEDWRDLT